MTDSRDAVRPLAAAVLTDGSIEIELYIPDQEETIETTIHATAQSKKAAPAERREIDLDDEGSYDDRVFRRMIVETCTEVQRQIDARKAEMAKKRPGRD
jgi:hypothetical protein